MSNKITILKPDESTADNVITALYNYRDNVKNITCIVELEDGETQVIHNKTPNVSLSYDSMLLQAYVLNVIDDE